MHKIDRQQSSSTELHSETQCSSHTKRKQTIESDVAILGSYIIQLTCHTKGKQKPYRATSLFNRVLYLSERKVKKKKSRSL